MKLKLGSTLIVGFGGLLAIGLAYWQSSDWYMFTLAPFAVWAWLYAYEEINVDSWHYKLAEYYFEVKPGACKACPYWGLAALATVIEIAGWVYAVLLQLAVYIWHSFWFMFGYKPDWRKFAYDRIHHGDGYLYRRRPQEGSSSTEMIISSVWPIFFIGPAVIVLAVLHIGTAQLGSFYHDWAAYYTGPITYVAVVLVALLGELWSVTGWPAMKWSYGVACPDVKFVKKAPVTAKPKGSATTNPY